MEYPTLTEYIQAVRDYPHISILDSVLKGGTPVRGPNSLRVYSGGFSIVFPFEVGSNTFALRCWRRDIGGAEIRYQEISSYLKQRNLPYFVEFEYIPEGILVKGERWPTTRMEWAEGETLREFVESNLHDPGVLRTAAAEFLKMVETLHNHQMSHGDLQDGNILLRRSGTDVEIKLIDYDSMFVPALRAQPDSVVVGLPEYQHPRRRSGAMGANEKIDYFSELVIYLTFLSLAEKPDLWNQFGGRQEKALLFVADDFTNPIQSNVFRQLDNLSPDIKLLASKLKEFCAKPSIDQLDPLESLLPRTDRIAKDDYHQGITLLHSNRYDKAIAQFEKAISIDSSFKEAHYGLGLSYLQMGNLCEAEKAVNAALKIDANYQDARELLDVIKQKQGAIRSNPVGLGTSPSSSPAHSSNPTPVGTSDGRSLRRHYFYLSLVVVCVICVTFALVLNSKNKTLRDLQGQLTSQVSANHELINEKTELMRRNQLLQRQLNDQGTQPEPREIEIGELEGEIANLRLKNEELKNQLSSRTSELASQLSKNQELENKNAVLQKHLAEEKKETNTQTIVEPQADSTRSPTSIIKAQKLTLSGHSNGVWNVAFSPDNKTVASASEDKTIRLWDAVAGIHKRTLNGHTDAVHTVVFSPDGKILASGSIDRTIRLWDSVSGTSMRTLTGHTDAVYSIVFSPDGMTLASAGGDKIVRMWNARTGRRKWILAGHSDAIFSTAFSPDGKTFASGSRDTRICLWDVATGKQKATLAGHTASVMSVVFSPDGTTLVSGSEDKTIRIWDTATGKHIRTLTGHTFSLCSVAYSPDGMTLASGSRDDTIRLWDAVSGEPRGTLTGHTDDVTDLAFSPDGKALISGSYDGTIRLWDLVIYAHKRTLVGHSKPVSNIAFSPDGLTLISGSDDGTVRLWDVRTGDHRRILGWQESPIESLTFSRDGLTLAVNDGNIGSRDFFEIRLLNVHTVQHLKTFEVGMVGLGPITFSPDGLTLAAGESPEGTMWIGVPKSIWLLDVITGESRLTRQGHSASVTCVTFSPDGLTLASGSYDNTVRLWNVVTGALKWTLKGHTGGVTSVAHSLVGDTLASGSLDNTVRLWDSRTGTHKWTLIGHTAIVESVAFSPGGTTLASGSSDKTIRLWDVHTGAHKATLMGHTQSVESVVFSADGLTLASGSSDNTIRLWTPW